MPNVRGFSVKSDVAIDELPTYSMKYKGCVNVNLKTALVATIVLLAMSALANASANSPLSVGFTIDCNDVRVNNRFDEIIRAELGKIPDVVIVNKDVAFAIHVQVLVVSNSTVAFSLVVLDQYTEWSAIWNSGVDMGVLRDAIHKVGVKGAYTVSTDYVGYSSLSNLKDNIGSMLTNVNLHDFQDVRLAKLNFVPNPQRWKPAPIPTPTPQGLLSPSTGQPSQNTSANTIAP